MYGRDAPGSRGRPAFFAARGTCLVTAVYQALATVLDPLVLANVNVGPIGLVQFLVLQ